MVEKADTQQYVEVCTLLLCSWSTVTITLHVAWYDDCRWFLDLTSELCGVMLFEVCMLCFIVTFHVTTFDKGNRLVADKTHRVCAPHRQHKCILVSPLFLKFAIFGINFSVFFGIRALGSAKRLETILLLWRSINKILFNWIQKNVCYGSRKEHSCIWSGSFENRFYLFWFEENNASTVNIHQSVFLRSLWDSWSTVLATS